MVQVIAVIFSAFGGFFESSLPEAISISNLLVGGASFASLIVMMSIKICLLNNENKVSIFRWLFVVGILIFFSSFVIYSIIVGRYVFSYPSADGRQYIAGWFPVENVAIYVQQEKIDEREYELLIEQFAAADEHGQIRVFELWSRTSIEITQFIIASFYLGMILGVSMSIFSFLEVIAPPNGTRRREDAARPEAEPSL